MVEKVPRKMLGADYAAIINDKAFEPSLGPDRTILQDNCPVQNCNLAKDAFAAANITRFSIPARSPDLNVIENMFNQIRPILRKEAIEQQITCESMQAFTQRITRALGRFSVTRINNLIDSYPKRIDHVIFGKGNRIKY